MAPESDLRLHPGRDGSFSLWSASFAEGFHCAAGALAEARTTFLTPSQLERFPAGARLTVVEVAVGTGTNTAALIEAARSRALTLDWWGLELDPRPLQQALAATDFRRAWAPEVLTELERRTAGPTLLWGDARARLADLPPELMGACDLVWLDAFSPRHCPQLWTEEFLGKLAPLLAPAGRLVSYGSAAAFRAGLRARGLHLAAIRRAPGDSQRWSGGTVASPGPLPSAGALRALSAMEEEHLRTRAALPYRDPSGRGTATELLAERAQRQGQGGGESTSAWRRRWGVGHGEAR